MWDNTETTISIDGIVSGEDGEIEYSLKNLSSALIRKIEGRF